MVRRIRVFISDAAAWVFWFPFRKLLQVLPLPVLYFVASASARCFYVMASRKRKEARAELEKCLRGLYPPQQMRKITLQSFEVYTKRHFEQLVLGKISGDLIERIVHIEGVEHIEDARSRGRGAVILLSHFGSYLMVLPALGFRGYKINQVTAAPVSRKGQRSIHKRVFKIRRDEYDSIPATFIRSDKSMPAAVRALKNNELVAVAFDGRQGDKWVPVRFFNRPANFSPGPVRLARAAGAVILPTFIIRQKDNTHRLIIERPFELEDAGDKEEFLFRNTQRLLGIFETYIAKYPCHFGMNFQIFKERAERGIIDTPMFSD